MYKKVIIIGAGPGGLASAMILAKRGYNVVVYEQKSYVGGRTSPQSLNGFVFELGPTFVMLPQVFEEIFSLADRRLSDYVDMKRLDVLYDLHFADGRSIKMHFDKHKLKKEIARLFPGDEEHYDYYLQRHKKKFALMFECLKVPYSTWYSYFNKKLLRAVPVMDLDKTLYQVLSGYFKHPEMRIAMAFQSKYLGMSPWECPGAFSILSYVEHAFGVYHPLGGVHKITEAMATVAKEHGADLRLNCPVKKVLIENGKAVGVVLENGTIDRSDFVVMNADFCHGMTDLVENNSRPSWNNKKIDKSNFSCSTFMIYLGLKKKYDLEHHNVYFAKDYKENVRRIFHDNKLSNDFSFYIQNAAATDESLSPEGKSTLYILVPINNLQTQIDWNKNKEKFKDLVLKRVIERTGINDLLENIEVEKVITPQDWLSEYSVYRGAVFNLGHNLSQMLYMRPHNAYNDIDGLYIVGGGAHPGSGLPTILESGRIAADLITKDIK